MNHQNKFLLPDKSFWKALDREQREDLVSKYPVFFPPILFNEVAKDGLNVRNAPHNLNNTFAFPHWFEHAKMDLLTTNTSDPILVGRKSEMRLIHEYSEEEIIALEEASSKAIERFIEREGSLKSQTSFIDPLKEKWLELAENTEDLSEKEWIEKLKEVTKKFQRDYPHPSYERILKHIESDGFPQNGIKPIQASIKALCDTFSTNSLENAYNLAVYLLKYNSSNSTTAYDTLQMLCNMFASMLTQAERTQIFNRFLDEGMPPIDSFAPHALMTAIWSITIQLFLRENPENIAPKDVLRDAEYMFYTFHKNLIFVSADVWHKKFVDEVPLFKPLRENFIFIPHKNKNAEEFKKGLRSVLPSVF